MLLSTLVVLGGVYMSKYHVMHVDDNVLKTQINLQNVIALYGDSEELLNVGYPYKAAYRPLQANMWGYQKSKIKELYVIIDSEYTNPEEMIYVIEIDDSRNIVVSKKSLEEELNKEESKKSNNKIIEFNKVKTKKRALK